MQKQLGIRMQAKRAAMLAENNLNIPSKDEDEDEEEEVVEVDEDSMDTTNESLDANSEIIEQENVRERRFLFLEDKILFYSGRFTD